jgi:hypothetical protein
MNLTRGHLAFDERPRQFAREEAGVRAATQLLSSIPARAQSPARDHLVKQQRQVVCPVVLTYAAGINHMRQIVSRIREDKVGMCNPVVTVTGLR